MLQQEIGVCEVVRLYFNGGDSPSNKHEKLKAIKDLLHSISNATQYKKPTVLKGFIQRVTPKLLKATPKPLPYQKRKELLEKIEGGEDLEGTFGTPLAKIPLPIDEINKVIAEWETNNPLV